MALKLYKFRELREAEIFLQGGIIGTDVSKGIIGLVGLTLTLTAPVVAHTFVTANRANNALLLKDIKAQLEAAQPLLRVTQIGGRIVLIEVTPTNGVQVPATSQAAKPLLGWDQNEAFSGKVYSEPGGVTPALASIGMSADNMIVVCTKE